MEPREVPLHGMIFLAFSSLNAKKINDYLVKPRLGCGFKAWLKTIAL